LPGGARYPVAQVVSIRLPEGVRRFRLQPVFADQEVDARAAGQPVYWEGAVSTAGGRGYLELTGYAADLRM
jgi:predicted secreted hydrolase